LKTVVNFDVATSRDDHIHRVGRTGRAGIKDCKAITLLTADQKSQAAFLIKLLEDSNTTVGKELEAVARGCEEFRRRRKMVIGLGKYKMEIDVEEETRKLRKQVRKVGDKSGIGFE
jgi:superfamily II DNA/RNA helicase